MKESVFIIGAGGVGREILSVLQHTSLNEKYDVSGFIDDGIEAATVINGIEVLGGIKYLLALEKANIIIALGNPKVRRKIIDQLLDTKFSFPTIIHPDVSFHDCSKIAVGKGTYITQGCILTTDILIGNFCFLNIAVSINHDAIVGDNCVLMPGVRITCGANLGKDSYVSPNCVLSKPVEIPAGSWITESI